MEVDDLVAKISMRQLFYSPLTKKEIKQLTKDLMKLKKNYKGEDNESNKGNCNQEGL